MKKAIFFWIVLLVAETSATTMAQTGSPCAPYDNSRTKEEMKQILLDDVVLRTTYANVINYNVGEMVVSSSDVEGMMENTIFFDVNFINESEYLNGVRYGNKINFTELTGQPSKYWAAYRYKGVDYIYAKVACMNPQKSKIAGICKNRNQEDSGGSSQQGSQKITKDNDFVPPLTIYEAATMPIPQESYEPASTPPTFLRKNWPWIAVTAAAILTGTAYLLLKKGDASMPVDPIGGPVDPNGGPTSGK